MKEYIFLFNSGGWNTISATSKRSAIVDANKKYAGDLSLVPNVNTFVLKSKNEELYSSLMGLFY
jgi:hypothetical protein